MEGKSTDGEGQEPIVITPEMLVPIPTRGTERRESRLTFEKNMSYLPIFVTIIIIVNLAIFIHELATGSLLSKGEIIRAGALERNLVLQGEYWRLISAAFLHGSWAHVIGNSLFMIILGMANEHAYGLQKTIVIYCSATLAGSLLSISMSPGPSIGASGAVFGLMGSLVVFFAINRAQFSLRDGNIGVFIGVIALIQIIIGFTQPYIDNYAHIGGFLGGATVAYFLKDNLTTVQKKISLETRTKGFAILIAALACFLTIWFRGNVHAVSASVLSDTGFTQQAIEAADQSLKYNEKNAYAYLLRGTAYYRIGRHDDASKDINNYLAQNPAEPTALEMLGHLYFDKEQYDTAVSYYTKAIIIQPTARLYNSRGYAFLLNGNFGSARSDFLQVIQMDKKYAPGYGNLGLLYAIDKEYGKAVEYLEKSYKIDSSLQNVKKLVEGLKYEAAGQKDLAVKSYQEFIGSIKPQNRRTWLAEIRFAEKQIGYLSAKSSKRAGIN